MIITQRNKLLIVGLHQAGNGARRIRRQLILERNAHHSVSAIQHVIFNWEENGTTLRRPGSGRRPSVARVAIRNEVSALLNPMQDHEEALSLRRAAAVVGMCKSTVSRIAKNDLRMHVFKKKKVHKLAVPDRIKRTDRCRNLLQIVTERKLSRVLFTDEKIFNLHGHLHPQNNRVWTTIRRKRDVPARRLLFEQPHFDSKVMVMCGVSLNGRSRIQFVDNNTTVDAQYYITRLLPRILTDCRAQIGPDFILQQDGAPCHTARSTQTFLQREAPNFITKDQWPPHSPDANPMDYGIWGALVEKVYRRRSATIADLKVAITAAWRQLSQRFIGRLIRQFRPRLQLIVNNNGGNIEQLLL